MFMPASRCRLAPPTLHEEVEILCLSCTSGLLQPIYVQNRPEDAKPRGFVFNSTCLPLLRIQGAWPTTGIVANIFVILLR